MFHLRFLRVALIAFCLTGLFSLMHPQPAQSEPPYPPKPDPEDREFMPYLSETGDVDGGLEMNTHENFNSAIEPNSFFDWEKTVYQSYRDGNWEIYLKDVIDYRLTNNGNSDANPDLDSKLSKIVFNSNRMGNDDIYTMTNRGANIVRLTSAAQHEYDPAWSNSGVYIAYVIQWGSNTQIIRMKADGSEQVAISDASTRNAAPAWSPDDKQIAWVKYNSSGGAIWLMSSDGSNQHQITSYFPYMGGLTWSPDGTKIAFDADLDGDGWNELGIVNSDGSNLMIHLDNGGDMREIWIGSWSTTGERIAFSRVQYVVYNQTLYLDRTSIQYTIVSQPNSYNILIDTGYDLNPDWQNPDIWPPSSRILPLPEYSRRTGFTITVPVQEIGPSGLPTTDMDTVLKVQKRIDGTTNWLDVFSVGTTQTPPFQFTLTHPSCETIYLRSSAKDDADNWEAWPTGEGDALTRMFDWTVSGKVRDSRENSLFGANVDFNPSVLNSATSSISGSYVGYACNEPNFSVTASKPAYSARPASNILVNHDVDFDITLAPLDNLISNPDFEDASPLSGWTSSGNYEPSTAMGFNGQWSAMIGKDCISELCLSGPEYVTGTLGLQSNLYVDLAKTVHLLSGGIYRSRPEAGPWSDPITLGSISIQNSQMIMDYRGILHVMIRESGDVYYQQKTADGIWSEKLKVGRGTKSRMAVDSNGNPHMLISEYDPIKNRNWVALYSQGETGEWSFVNDIYSNAFIDYDFAIDQNNIIHFMAMPGLTVWHQTLTLTGESIAYEYVYTNNSSNLSPLLLKLSDNGEIHAFIPMYWGNSQLAYTRRTTEGIWTSPLQIPEILYDRSEIQIDETGTIYIAGSPATDGIYNIYRIKNGDSSFTKTTFQNDDLYDVGFAVDNTGRMHLYWKDYVDHILTGLYYTTELMPASTENLSQSISIPVEMHKPTLSFTYKTDFSDAVLEVIVSTDDGDSSFYQPASTEWSHAWIDMSSWKGQDTTINFVMHQPEGAPHRHLYLDEISLGSWQTPIIQQISPANLTEWNREIITITGVNLIEGATVWLNGIEIPAVEYVDENTLRITLPGNFEIGLYDVKVVNPQGQSGSLLASLRLGYATYLPVSSR